MSTSIQFDIEKFDKEWAQYIEFTRTTAVYPGERAIDYCIFGLCSEYGEFQEAVNKLMLAEDKVVKELLAEPADDTKPSNGTTVSAIIAALKSKRKDHSEYNSLIKELGDLYWYCARLIDELNLDIKYLSYCFDDVVNDFVSSKSDGDYSTYLDLYSTLLKLLGVIVGSIADVAKKNIRDGYTKQVFLDKVTNAVKDLLFTLVLTAYLLETDYEQVISTNKDKLTSRKERNVIKGEGDDR